MVKGDETSLQPAVGNVMRKVASTEQGHLLKKNDQVPVINQHRNDRAVVVAPNIETCRNDNVIQYMTDDRSLPVYGN